MNALQSTNLVTHRNPHTEELLEIYLLKKYGRLIGRRFTDPIFLGSSVVEKIKDNTFYLGVGGNHNPHQNVFDEHSFDKSNTNAGENNSSIQILTDRFPIFKSLKALKYLIDYAHHEDTHDDNNMMELGRIIKTKFASKSSEKEVMKWTDEVFDNCMTAYDAGEEFHAYKEMTRGKHFSRNEIDETLAMLPSGMSAKCNRFVLRRNFCVRDVVAVMLAKRFGKKIFGRSNQEVCFVDPADYVYVKGDYCIGFRCYNSDNNAAKDSKSSTGRTLFQELPAVKMAKIVGLRENGSYQLVMKYVNNLNVREGYDPFELASLLSHRNFKNINKKSSRLFWDSFKWTTRELAELVKKQQMYFDAKNDFHQGLKADKRTTQIHRIRSKRGARLMKIGVIETDNTMMASYAMGRHALQCDIVICRNSNGNIYIATRYVGRSRYNASGIVGKLRFKELSKKGIDTHSIDKSLVYAKDNMPVCPEWFYHKEKECIMNGSPTHPDVPPTSLSLDAIINIVKNDVFKYLNPKKALKRAQTQNRVPAQ